MANVKSEVVQNADAKRRGAERVLATDSYCWSHSRARGRETFDLARSEEWRLKPIAEAKRLEYERGLPILGKARALFSAIRRISMI
jgi:hypothetical protein